MIKNPISLWLVAVSSAIAINMNLSCLAADDRVKVDNAFARVLVVNSPAGAVSALHEHKMNRVMVYLDAGEMSITDTSGAGERLKFKAGDALWSPATMRPHVSATTPDHSIRIVEVELKSTPGSGTETPPKPEPGQGDWVRTDTNRYHMEFENDQVRVVRARYAAHEKGTVHEHTRNYVAVFITDGQITVSSPNTNAPTRTGTHRAGDVVAGVPATHSEENAGDNPLEIVVIEFKK